MDNNEIFAPGAPNQDPVEANEGQDEDYRAIFYRMEVARRVEDFKKAIENGHFPLIAECSQLIIYKNYFNQLTGAHQTSIRLLQEANKLSEYRLPQSQPLSPARRIAEMHTQAAILQEHQVKRDKTTELCHSLSIKLDELITAKSSPDLLPACRMILDQFNSNFKSQLETCLVISAEIRAVRNLVCLDLGPEAETKDAFEEKFALLRIEHNPPKVKALTMSTGIKRCLGLGLAINAESFKITCHSKSPIFNNHIFCNFSPSRHNFASDPASSSTASTAGAPTTEQPAPTESPSRRQPQPESSAQLPEPWEPSTATPTATSETPELQPTGSSTPRPSRQTTAAPLTPSHATKFIFTNNIFVCETLLGSPNLEGIKSFFTNIKRCFGDTTDFPSQVRTRIADLAYLQRALILSCRLPSNSSEDELEPPLITAKKVNFLPKPPSNHCLTMALNFLELLKTGRLKQPVSVAPPDCLPPGYISVNSDKTSNCCILLKSTYTSLMNDFLLKNDEIFEKSEISSAFTDIKRVEKVLSHIRKLSSDWRLFPAESQAVLSKNATLPKLRGLAKTHKPHDYTWSSIKFRPIIGSSSSVLSNLATLLDKVLQPLATRVAFRIRDSFHALNFFQGIDLQKYYIVAFDAVSLYTNISLELAIDAVTFWFDQPGILEAVPPRFHNMLFIVDALQILFSHNYFTFNGDIYLQKDGLSMGCNSAVSIAELALGFLETSNNFDPKFHKRYIDDAVDVVLKTEASTEIPRLLAKYNSLDPNIKWTCEFDLQLPKTIFLDLVVDYSIPGIYQYHKPTKKIDSFVPYYSLHSKHTLRNLPRSLFDRAITLNTTQLHKDLAFKQIEQGLSILKYPNSIIETCKLQAKKIIPTKYIAKTGNLSKKIIYLCITNNSLNTSNPLHSDISTLNRILHMDDSGILNNIHIKISKRQPPSVGTLNNMRSGAHNDQDPVRCGRKICDICPLICTSKTVSLVQPEGEFVEFKAARFTCKSHNLIYFIFDPISREPLYIGHTGQKLLTRMYQHRGGKKKNSGKSKIRFGFLKNTSPNKINFQITAIAASPYRVKRLETERFYINKFKPTWNTQLQHFWWQDASFEFTEKD